MNQPRSPGSKSVEGSMDDIVAATNANLAMLEKAKRSAQGTADARAHYIESKRFLSPELYQQAESRPRASSAPRGAGARVVAFEDEGAFEQKRDDGNTDRRFEAYLRKQKVMEERLRRLEQQRATDSQTSQALNDEKDKLIEERRADHKLIQNLRSQISSLKNRVDLLVSDEQQREAKILSEGPADLTQQIKDLVSKRVEAEMARATDEIVAKVLREQGASLGKSTQSLGDSKIFARSAGVEQFTSLEREMIRLSGEFERMKTRNGALEGVCADLKNTASIREIKAEEAHKKAINAHRVEVETFLGSAARRTADALASVQTHTREIGELRQDLENFIERIGNVLAEFDMKLTHHDNSKEEVYSVLERLEGDVVQLKNQFSETEASTVRFLEDSMKLARVAGAVENHGRQLQVTQERMESLDMQLQATSSSVDAHAVPIDLLAKSIDAINEKFESRTDTLRQSIDGNKGTADKVLHELNESQKRTRGKVRDLTESVKSVSQIRQSIEAVLKEVDNRAKQDASWTYSFKTALQRIEGRVQVMEQTLNPGYHSAPAFSPLPSNAGADSAPNLGPITPRREAGTGTLDIRVPDTLDRGLGSPLPTSAVLSGRPVPLLGTQFDEIRALITDLRQEIHRTNQAERDELRESVTTLVEDRVNALDAKCSQLVQDANQHAENYVEEQLQGSLDYTAQHLQQVRDLVMDVQVLQDQLTTDHEELRRSLTAELEGVKSDVVAATSTAASAEATARAEALSGLQSQVSTLESALNRRIDALQESSGAQSAATVEGLTEKTAELRATLQALSERVEQAKACHGATVEALRASLEECQTSAATHETSLADIRQELETQDTTWREAVDRIASQLQRVQDTAVAKVAALHVELETVKEDLVGHINFTNECFGDNQSVLEEKFTQVNGDLDSQIQAHHELQSLFAELDAFATQTDTQVRGLISDMDVKVTQGHVLLDRSVTDLEHALASHEAGVKGKIAGTEKRLAMQEAAMKERVISLEVKIGGLEESLRTRVATMEGSLASQEEQLRESVPIELHRQQDAALELKISQASDALRAQIITVKERVTEMETRIAAQEGELSNVAATFTAKLNTHQEKVTAELAASRSAQASTASALSEDIMRTVDDRNAGIRELIFQIHELLNAQQEEVTQSTELLTQQIASVETSIAATDSLLAEQVNEIHQQVSGLQMELQTKVDSDQVDQLMTQLRETVEEQLSSADQTVRERCAAHVAEVSRKCADLDHRLSSSDASVRVKFTELDSKLDAQETDSAAKFADVNQAISTAQQASVDQALQWEEKLISHDASLTEIFEAEVAALQGKLGDLSQLLQLQEKRLRTAEKTTDARFTEVGKKTEELVAQLNARIATISAAMEKEGSGNKETVGTLTQQLISMQTQLNDHADEVRTILDSEITVMRDLVSTEMTDYASASSSVQRLEEWLSNLQRAHDDHLGQFDSSSHAQELCLQKVESSLAALQSTVHATRSSTLGNEQEQRGILERLTSELASIDSVAKQRLSSLEQRLVRQEALSREKVTDVECRLGQHSEKLTSKLQEFDATLSAHGSRIIALEGDRADFTATLRRMGEIEARISTHDAAADGKIQEIEGFIVNQVKAMQSRTLPTPATHTRSKSSTTKPAASDVRRSDTRKMLETTVEAEVPGEGNVNDLSRISRISISPVRKTGAGNKDILNQLVTLTNLSPSIAGTGTSFADESVLFGSPSNQNDAQRDAEYDDRYADEEFEAADEQENQQDKVLGMEEGGSEGEEEALTQFNSMIQTVNTDIATLGAHLSAFYPQQASPPEDALAEQAAAEEQEMERQSAVESLQLKKFNHRRKFQRVLFENK